MERIPEITEAELDQILGGKGEPTICLTSVDGSCICPP